MKILVLGASGMLGHAVGRHMINVFGEDSVWLSFRNTEASNFLLYGKNHIKLDLPDPYAIYHIPMDCTYIINCIGVIKPFVDKVGVENTIQINSIFPHLLERYCRQSAIKLIHISTDCTFSGKKGNYTEIDAHDCTDVYGQTKSLGELFEHAMTIRTSIIGEELHNRVSLIEWVKSQKGRTISGFTNHFWNGITTKQYAKVCEKIINQGLYCPGKAHVFSPEYITKEGLLHLFNEKYNLYLKIAPTEAIPAVDRTLSTVLKFNSLLEIPSIQQQIMEL